MQPAVNSAVVQPQTQCRGGWCVWARITLVLVLFLGFTGCFAVAAYRARHHHRDLAYALAIYFLLVLLVCCLVKLEQLRRDPARRRRVRVAVWVVSVTLANTFASRVAELMPVLALKMVVWAVATVVTGIAFYYLFCGTSDAGCCDVEHGRRPETAVHELSPEEKV
ncbi:hypothetical protein PR202_ga23234 [Eleusine coracana subsp. coracana]|uniref:Uncharacterized protein n=1 Tax=Eleusine coracana subsp. coracana TaxID=191504 RepID=A0AAV5D550_ELECO|nr:hypothetical protein QOZ80_1AG0012470 [Eleusine coracana subsp. coracana]GJN05591.1 hypothetical protein PR202_ga23234 [Eleusine coracana subsp. coracana]